MIKPDLIIFDCDGVLVDSEMLSCRCLSDVLAGVWHQPWSGSGARSVPWTKRDGGLRALPGAGTRRFPSNFRRAEGGGSRRVCLRALPDRRRGLGTGGSADPALRRLVQRCRSGVPLAVPDRSCAAFRHAPLYLANGGARQARARSLPVRGRKDAGGSASHPRDRGQRQRRQGRQGGRHDGLGICRRQPLSIARRQGHPARGGSRSRVRANGGFLAERTGRT